MSNEPSPTSASRTRPRHRLTVLGVLGELLLTSGVVILLFLAWQLWWNNAMLALSQSSAAANQSQVWAGDTANRPASPAPPASNNSSSVDYGPPAVLAEPDEGQAFAVMYVPRFGENTERQIAEGVGADVLNSTRLGIGHYDGSAMPGAIGNFAIASHRSAYGGGMHLLNQLQVGDPIYIQTADGWYTYRFRNFEYVRASAVAVIDSVPQDVGTETGQRLITLTTCNPLYSTAERIVAYGVFESWQPTSAGPPAAIAADVASWKK